MFPGFVFCLVLLCKNNTFFKIVFYLILYPHPSFFQPSSILDNHIKNIQFQNIFLKFLYTRILYGLINRILYGFINIRLLETTIYNSELKLHVLVCNILYTSLEFDLKQYGDQNALSYLLIYSYTISFENFYKSSEFILECEKKINLINFY